MTRRLQWLGICLLTTIGCWLAWSLWVLSDAQYRGLLSPITVTADSANWRVARGQVVQGEERLRIQGTGRDREVVVLLNMPTPLPVEAVGSVVLFTSDQDDIGADLIWSTQPQFIISGREPLIQVDASRAEARLNSESDGDQFIYFLAIQQQVFERPWSIHSVEIHPVYPDFLGLQGMLWKRIFDPRPWQHTDINYNYQQPFGLQLSLMSLALFWATGLFLVLGVWQARRGGDWRLAVVVGVLVVWVSLDIRWQSELMGRSAQAIEFLTGDHTAPWPLDEGDQAIHAFAQQLTTTHRREEFNRVFSLGYEYEALRLRYHMAKWGVRAITPQRWSSRWTRRLEAGDLVLIVDPWDIQIQPLTNDFTANPKVRVSEVSGAFSFEGRALMSHQGFWAIMILSSIENNQ